MKIKTRNSYFHCKDAIQSISFQVDYGYDIARNSFCRRKHYIFHRSLMFLSCYLCLHYFFHKHIQHNFYKLGIILWKMFSRQPDRWYQVESSACDTLCCQDRIELTHGQACMCMYVLIKRMVQVNIKIQNYQTSVKNVTLMSAKTVSSDIIPVFKQKENKLYNILAIKVAFFALFFVFRVFLLISYLF